MKNTITLQSIITCPECGFQKEEIMPTDACQYFYKCTNCETVLKPKEGDCCVFCSYGTMPCPTIQMEKSCCNWLKGSRKYQWSKLSYTLIKIMFY